MQISKTTLRDAFLVTLEPTHDNRGFFARSFSVEEFACRGLEANFRQHSISYSERAGTLRGMHYQLDPASEVKLVRCTRGLVHDVITFAFSLLPTGSGKPSLFPRKTAASFIFERALRTVFRRSAMTWK